jgi:hypothetical protein
VRTGVGSTAGAGALASDGVGDSSAGFMAFLLRGRPILRPPPDLKVNDHGRNLAARLHAE